MGKTKEESFYSSTPPLEAQKLLFAKCADAPIVNGKPMRRGFGDAKKAYFNGIPKRNVFMRLPRELGLPPHGGPSGPLCVCNKRCRIHLGGYL